VSKCGFDYPDYNPGGGGVDDHLVIVDTGKVPGTLAATTGSSNGSIGIAIDGNKLDFTVVPVSVPVLNTRYYFNPTPTTTQAQSLAAGFPVGSSEPSANINGAPYPPGNTLRVFDTQPGDPNQGAWDRQTLTFNLWSKAPSLPVDHAYTLVLTIYRESADGSTSTVWPLITYSSTDPLFFTDWGLIQFGIPVPPSAGPSTDRLKIRVGIGGNYADTFDVFFGVGGAHASYIDTLFTGGGGTGSADHQTLYNRGTFLDPANAPLLAHPMSDIEPGRVHSPTGTTIATVSGLFAMPDSNSASISGTEPLLGIAKAGWQRGDRISITFSDGRPVQGSATVPGTHACIYLGSQFQDPTNPGAGRQFAATVLSVLELMYDGGGYWLLASQPTVV
jgi:hypothetical protein